MRLLVVTAVDAERDALDLPDVLVGGIGPAASAAATSAALARGTYDLVLSAGIAGGFAPLAIGDIAVASTIAHADLGGELADGFRPIDAAPARYEVAPRLGIEIADRTGGHLGTILTVSTVTGTAASADALLARHPDAVAEAMEGAGVAAAATLHGVPFAEVRAISNLVGPHDRDAWRIGDALTALGVAVTALARGWDT
ncbi:MAG: futalosine hydrolase [Jatrophihabitantaceae bacterium]